MEEIVHRIQLPRPRQTSWRMGKEIANNIFSRNKSPNSVVFPMLKFCKVQSPYLYMRMLVPLLKGDCEDSVIYVKVPSTEP